MSNDENMKFSYMTARFSKDVNRTVRAPRLIKDRYIEISEETRNSPEYKQMIRNFKIGIKVLDARKPFLVFFKRKLKPHEKAELYTQLLLEEIKKEVKA